MFFNYDAWNNEVVLKRKEVSAKFWKDIHLKESLLYQKSRARWIKDGDVISKYFHSLLKYRRRRGNIKLLDENGGLLEDVEVV